MTHALYLDGAWTEARPDRPLINADSIAVSWETFQGWPDEERSAFGARVVPEPGTPPEGKVETSRTLGGPKSGPKWIVTYGDAPEPGPASPAAVDTERDRRITAGFTYQGEHFQSRPEDQDNIRDGYAKANRVIRDGGGAVGDVFWYGDGEPFGWIAADNSVVALDAPAMVAFAETLGKRKKDLIFAASEIKRRLRSGETIADVTADSLWPA